MQIGFIGLGAMGGAIATNLRKAGHVVRAWNRSGVSVPDLEAVDAPEEALRAEVVFSMLPDDPTIRSVLLESGALERAVPRGIHVCCSTISVAFAAELAERHRALGIGYLSAPVLGRPDAAARAELNILAAGDPAVLDAVRPLLAVLGRRTWELGSEPPRANAAKLACNMMITMAIEAMAEAVVLTEAHGVQRDAFFELMLGTLFGGRAYESYSRIIGDGKHEPGFKAVLGLKDLRLATEAAAASGRRMPMLDAVRGEMAGAVAAGLGERDWSIIAARTIAGDDGA